MPVVVILITLVFEVLLAITWNPVYCRHGILLYRKRYKLKKGTFEFPDVRSLSGKFCEKFAPSFVFSQLSRHEIAFREKLFQLTLFGYTPILRAYVYHDSEDDELVLKCFSNIYIAAFLGVAVYYVMREPDFKISSSSLLIDLSILAIFFGFLMAGVGGIAAYQVQKYKQIVDFLIEDVGRIDKPAIESSESGPDQHKVAVAKKVIFVGWTLAIIGALCVARMISQDIEPPLYCMALFIPAPVTMLVGVFIGSRSAGLPLDTQHFLSLLLGYPRWILAIIYILTLIFMPIIFSP